MTNTTARRSLSALAGDSWRHWLDAEYSPPVSIWPQLLWTAVFSAGVALVFTLIGFAISARTLADWVDLDRWLLWYGRNLVIALIVGYVIQALFRLLFRLVGKPRIRALAGWRRSLFFTAVPMVGTAIGWPIAMSLVFGRLRVLANISASQVVSLVVIAALVSLAFHQYFSLRHKEINARMRANEAQLRLLQGQMEPHFLFNTLANVISLIDADGPRARHMLEALTDYLRASLAGLRHDDSTLGVELDLARRYLELMRTRMGERLHFEIAADEALREAVLMPLVLQPLIENAVKHGLEPQVDGGTVRVKAARTEVDGRDALQVCVEDDGAGPAAAALRPRRHVAGGLDGNGIALANLRERLQARFGAEAALTLAELEGSAGTRACLVIPWRAVRPAA